MPLHLLILPSFYPTRECPLDGIFFKEQARMLKAAGIKVGILYPEIRPLKQIKLRDVLRNRFQTSFSVEEGMPTGRLHGWNLFPGYLKGTMQQWSASAHHLYNDYVRKQGKPDLIHAHSALWQGSQRAKSQSRADTLYPYRASRPVLTPWTIFTALAIARDQSSFCTSKKRVWQSVLGCRIGYWNTFLVPST